MPYRVEISSAAGRDLKRLTGPARDDIETAISSFASDPRPKGCRKLAGWVRRYRQGIGHFRLIYDIYEPEQIVVIARVIRRGETTYRRLR